MNEENIKRLITCINRIDGKYYDMARKSSAGENEVAVLYSLSDGGEHSQKSICREWLIPKTTINSIVRKMLGDGTVEVTSLSGREKMLKLTDGGMEKAAGTLAGLHAAEKYAMQKTLEKFDASFIDALETFSQHLEEFGEK